MANVTSWQVTPARPARYGAFPAGLDSRIVETLRARGIEKPYVHQAQAINAALAGTGFRGSDPNCLRQNPVLQRRPCWTPY